MSDTKSNAEAIEALREEIISLAQWAYAAAGTDADEKNVERIVDRAIGLISAIEANH